MKTRNIRHQLGLWGAPALLVLALQGCSGGGGGAVTVQATPTNVPRLALPHTGVTNNQCFDAGNSTSLVPCGGATVTELNAQQDGHRVTLNQRQMHFAQVGNYPLTDCVQDSVTGLIWEIKTAPGTTRAITNSYTNFDDQFDGGDSRNVRTSYNASGYRDQVNKLALCGFTDWRLPTIDELHTLVDYSRVSYEHIFTPDIFDDKSSNGFYFPYWSSSPDASDPNRAWALYSAQYIVEPGDRNIELGVRLVRP